MDKPLDFLPIEKPQYADLVKPPLNTLIVFLTEWIPTQPYPMRLKDAQTRCFTVANEAAAELQGCPLKAYIGLTIEDLAQPHAFNTSAIETHRQYDAQVCQERCNMSFQQVWLNAQGLIRVETVYKTPIFMTDQPVVALLESSHDRTLSEGLEPLFSHYEQAYPIRQAIQYFLTHICLKQVFHKLPTRRELLTLLSLGQSSAARHAAVHLKISERTVEEYKARLNCKLKGINLHELLVKLRAFR